jgi:hypothetical protein
MKNYYLFQKKLFDKAFSLLLLIFLIHPLLIAGSASGFAVSSSSDLQVCCGYNQIMILPGSGNDSSLISKQRKMEKSVSSTNYLYASPSYLSGFEYPELQGPSASYSFGLTGILTSQSFWPVVWINIGGPLGIYEVSTDNVTWQGSVDVYAYYIGPNTWMVSSVIWVRLCANLPEGIYPGTLIIISIMGDVTLVSLMGAVTPVSGPVKYKWIGQNNASWKDPLNWSPPRNLNKALASDDIISFEYEGGITSLNITDVPSQTIGRLNVEAPYNIYLIPEAPNAKLSIKGEPDNFASLNVNEGATLNLPGPNALSVNLLNGSFGEIDGSATIGSGGTLTINPEAYLIVDGILSNYAGPSGILVKSDTSGTGSLITQLPVSGTVERYISGNEWHLISSPISNGLSGIFEGYYLQSFSEATSQYTDIQSLTDPLTVATGFALYSESDMTAQFAGSLNTGYIEVPVTDLGDGWNLVGNPYPSSVDWYTYGWSRNTLYNATYRHVSSNTWASFVNGVGTNGGTNMIAPGQGFFVRAFAPGILGMNRVQTPFNTPFFKNTEGTGNDVVRLRLFNKNNTDETVVRIVPEATQGFDGDWDAFKLFGSNNDACQIFTKSSDLLSINSIPAEAPVTVGVRGKQGDTCLITSFDLNDFSQVTLEDTRTGSLADLKVKPYVFTLGPDSDDQRFILRFAPLAVDIKESETFSVYSSDHTIYVNMADNKTSSRVLVYNSSGQAIACGQSSGGRYQVGIITPGLYMVKVITGSSSNTHKVVVK